MQSTKKVVIITHSEDITGMIKELRASLEARGVEVHRFDTDRFPLEAQASFSQDGDQGAIRFACGERSVVVGPDDAIWYRRARFAEKLPRTIEPQMRQGCVIESKAFLRALLAAAPCFVLDPPDLVRSRGHKLYQLRLARELGMATPRTLVTNDPAEARAFIGSCPGGVVAKMLAGFPIYDENGVEQVVFTTTLDEGHLDKLDGLRYSPMVFQEKLQKAVELRITVIGGRMWAAAVDSQAVEGAEVDWRARGVTLLRSWREYTLPADLERALHRYMERIGMHYSAIDVIVEPSGRHVFLEANPAGECFWMQYNAPHFPFSDALADVLVGVPGARRSFLAQ